MQPLFKVYDRDGSGSLDYKEFANIVFGNEGGSRPQTAKKGPANTQE